MNLVYGGRGVAQELCEGVMLDFKDKLTVCMTYSIYLYTVHLLITVNRKKENFSIVSKTEMNCDIFNHTFC